LIHSALPAKHPAKDHLGRFPHPWRASLGLWKNGREPSNAIKNGEKYRYFTDFGNVLIAANLYSTDFSVVFLSFKLTFISQDANAWLTL
jgi:hypothetical protein